VSLRSLLGSGGGVPPSGGEEPDRAHAGDGVLDKRDRHVARAELVLAADAARPLRAVPLKPDLLQSFAAAVLDVRPELGSRSGSACVPGTVNSEIWVQVSRPGPA